jgi:tetratricopeptide (TPR) repeat protein
MAAPRNSPPSPPVPVVMPRREAGWIPLVAGVLLVLAAFIAYSNSFAGPFIFDDEIWITRNPTLHHLWPLGPVLFPPPDLVVRGRPILNLSLAINYALSGDRVGSYHGLNLTVHVVAALAVFGIVRRTLLRLRLRRAGPASAGVRTGPASVGLQTGPASVGLRAGLVPVAVRAASGSTNRQTAGPALSQPEVASPAPHFLDSATALAFVVALLWMLHPLQTEAVTYIIQRAESLMGMFYLLTLYCFIRGAERGLGFMPDLQKARSQSARRGSLPKSAFSLQSSALWFAASIVSCLLGMATKEVMVSAPVIVLLYDRTFMAGSFREAWRQRRWVHLGLAATWLELGLLMPGIGGRGAGFNLGINAWTYALTECQVVVHYLWLAVWPHPLILDYGGDVVRRFAAAAPYALVLAGLVGAAAVAFWRRPAWGFAGAWVFGILAATSSFIPVAFQPMAEHRMYLPLVAVVTAAVLSLYARLGRKSLFLWLAVAVGFGVLTAKRNEDYRSALSIWTDTVAKRPGNPRAQNYLALTLAQSGRLAEALGHFQEATRLKADFAEAYNNTGTCLLLLNRPAEAAAQYEQALVYKSDYSEAQYNLGDAFFGLGRFPEAAQHFQEAVRLKPDYVEAHLSLAAAWERMGRAANAIEQYQEILRINPSLAQARDRLARLQAQQPSGSAEK